MNNPVTRALLSPVRVLCGAIWLFASIGKMIDDKPIVDPQVFGQISLPFAGLLVGIELSLAIAMLSSRARILAPYIAIVLLLLFSAYTFFTRGANCSCFGAMTDGTWLTTWPLTRNFLFIVLHGVVVFTQSAKVTGGPSLRADGKLLAAMQY